MAGNLCRCGAYANIVPAVLDVAGAAAAAGDSPMKAFGYRQAPRVGRGHRLRCRRPECRLPRRRNESRRPDAAGRGAHRPVVDVSRLSPDDHRHRRRVGCGSAPASATATSPPTCASAGDYPGVVPGPARRVRPGSCGTWQPSAATCCSAPDACTSRTSASRATSGRPGPDARPGPGFTAIWACWAPVPPASPPTRRTWPSRSLPSTRSCDVAGAGRRSATLGWTSSTGCPATTRPATPRWRHGELITASNCPPPSALAAVARVSQGARPGVLRVRRRRRSRRPSTWSTTRCRRRAVGVRRRRARPWRARTAEDLIRGGPATRDAFAAALAEEFAAAEPLPDNAFKVPLARTWGRDAVGVGRQFGRRSSGDRRLVTGVLGPGPRCIGSRAGRRSPAAPSTRPSTTADDLVLRLAGALASPPAGSPTSTPPTVRADARRAAGVVARQRAAAGRRRDADARRPAVGGGAFPRRGRRAGGGDQSRRSPGRPRRSCR